VDHNAQEAKFRRAFDAYFDALNRYCLRRIPADDVNDVVAEVFLVAWRKIDRIPDEPHSLPWLYQVAHHEISNRRRSTRRLLALKSRVGGLANHPEPGPESVVVRNEQYSHLMRALSNLRSSDREILLLRTHEDCGYEEIATVLSCSPEAARKRLARAVHRLRKEAGIMVSHPAEGKDAVVRFGGDG
jgi:RNA polymerase sigma factor (sigma-70 family)